MRKYTPTRQIRVGDLAYDEGFQRDIDRNWVTKLKIDLDSRAIGALIVSERTDGSLVVVDGQHRGVAATEKWGPNATVICVVHQGLTRAEEADLFYRLNQRRGLKAYDRFNAEVVARHSRAVDVAMILELRGLTYGKGTGPKCVAAIAALERAHDLGTLGTSMTLLADSWGYAKSTWDGHLIDGMSMFLSRHPDADIGALRKKLATYKGGAEGFLGKAKQWKELHRTSMGRATAALLVDTYNLRRSADKQLPSWS